ncbi:MAG TPA: ABC transporter substrate-binding protein, partial [Methylomirabilota bacterium]|nr:ABC transporter substrate-binding protein [Methylomirabilota bacterium]
PIVTVAVGDPVGAGLASSLARPGGNVTGLSQASTDLSGKWLEILKELVPRASRVAVLRNSGNPLHLREYWKETEITARARLLTLVPIDAPDSNKFDRAFAEMSRAHAEGLVVYPRPAFASRPEIQKRFVELARVQRLPTMYYQSSFVEVGGLVSYGVDPRDSYRRVAVYVDKILKGRKPADLPIEQPTKFELAINLKTAKGLGLTVPPSLLLRADQIIE